MKITVILFFAVAGLYAQSPNSSDQTESGFSYFSAVIALLTLLILISGILVQKRWKG